MGGGIHKQVSVMLNIKLTLSGGGGLVHVCDICSYIHSQELLLLELPLPLVLLATGLLTGLTVVVKATAGRVLC